MSYRRGLSFADDEKELVDYFDNNGKSDIAKEAMRFYKENKDNVLTEAAIKLLKMIGIGNQSPDNIQKPNLTKINKLIK
jgi:hypothetical protein